MPTLLVAREKPCLRDARLQASDAGLRRRVRGMRESQTRGRGEREALARGQEV